MQDQSREISILPSMFVQRKLGNFDQLKEEYEIPNSKLGEGVFGSVEVVQLKATGQKRAMKKIDKELFGSALSREALLKEIDILKTLDHPNILKIYEFYEDKRYLYIITELCQGRELFDFYLEKLNKGFSEKKVMKMIQQVLSALQYAHSLFITHRDIKLDNMMIEPETNKIKVIDWGTSTSFKDVKIKELVGSQDYIAPEILKQIGYDNKVDIWSLGIVMYILVTGETPFSENSTLLLFESIKSKKIEYSEEIWSKLSKECKDLNQKMLTQDPKKRISAAEALQHPWFQVHPTKICNKLLKGKLQSLKTFKYQSKLQMATIQYVASHLLSQTEKDELSELFVHLDTNKDGRLSKSEIIDGYSKINGKSAQDVVDKIFAEVDADQNGTIDYNEFLACTMNQNKLLRKGTLKKAFDLFDVDGDGEITAIEIRTVLQSNADAFDANIWEEVIKEVDRDGNGIIDFEEFCAMMDGLAKTEAIKKVDDLSPFQRVTRGMKKQEEQYQLYMTKSQSEQPSTQLEQKQQSLQVIPLVENISSKKELISPQPKTPKKQLSENCNKENARKRKDIDLFKTVSDDENQEDEEQKETPKKKLKKK